MTTESMAPASPLLAEEWAVLRRYLPDLADVLGSTELAELETPDGSAIEAFRTSGGPRLPVPTELGGLGATATEMAALYRVIGSRAPSLAVSTMMHQLSIATVIEAVADASEQEKETAALLVAANALLASGFAESTPGSTVFRPTATATRHADGFTLTGRKRPCSLSASMDIMMCSVEIAGAGRGIALVPAASPGVQVNPFWCNSVLAAAQSDEVILDEVVVPAEFVIAYADIDPDGESERTGYIWFGILALASYLGIATRLLTELLARPGTPAETYAAAAAAIETAWSALQHTCAQFDSGCRDAALSASVMHQRYALSDQFPQVAATTVEALGGAAFCSGSDITYLVGCLHAFSLHPPSRTKIAPHLLTYGRTGSFTLPINTTEPTT